jgi:hypothetical protein
MALRPDHIGAVFFHRTLLKLICEPTT